MHPAKRKALAAAGFNLGDAADFLEMTPEERQLLDARLTLAQAIRRQRQSRQLSQKQLGQKLKTSQPRIAKIERAAPDVSLDQMVRAFTAAGGKLILKPARRGAKPSRANLTLKLTHRTR
jgi:predicted XRE-type DNA-binding protein